MKWKKQLVRIVGAIALFWTLLTILAEAGGKQQVIHSAQNGSMTALIIYNPDPFNNLDEKVSRAFAEGLQESGYTTKIATNKKMNTASSTKQYDLYVFCANTYNFAPDKGIRKAIKNLQHNDGQQAIAIVLGSGSTKQAEKRFNRFLKKQKFNVVGSQSFWLMRTNDETATGKNANIGAKKAKEWAREISRQP